MLIAILILLCLIFFLVLLILGEVVLIKKRLYHKQVKIRQLPLVKPDILRTMAEELDKVGRSDGQAEHGRKWADEFFSEQPSLFHFLSTASQAEGRPNIVPAIIVYKLLKAQAEADSLTDLTKIKE